MNPATAMLVIRLVELLAGALASYPAVKRMFDAHLSQVRQFVAEGRDPTPEELAALHAEGDAISEAIRAAVDARSVA